MNADTNPLTHDHEDNEREPFEPQDPAQQSLADALRWCFFLLKLAMIVVVVFYCFSGVFQVKAQEKVVRLRFGSILGVYEQGWHFGFPYPIEQDIRIPTTEQTLNLDTAYWFEELDGDVSRGLDDQEARRQGQPLNPEKDGSLLTGDANIIHAKFVLRYEIVDAEDYVQNVGNAQLAEQIVTNVAEQGIVFAAAQAEADELIRSRLGTQAETRMREVLNEMGTGISIKENSLVMVNATMPLNVRSAYRAVNEAESERGFLIDGARKTRDRILGEAAGGAHGPLFSLIKEFEAARMLGDAARERELDDEIDLAFDNLRMDPRRGGASIGGQASQLINEARAYRQEVVEQVKTEANTFRNYLDEYRRNPRMVMARLWESTREKIFSRDDIEVFSMMPGQVYINWGRDPKLARDREKKRLEQEQKDAIGRNRP